MSQKTNVSKMEIGKKLTTGLVLSLVTLLIVAGMFAFAMTSVQNMADQFKAYAEVNGALTAGENLAYAQICGITHLAAFLILSIMFLLMLAAAYYGLAAIKNIEEPVKRILGSIQDVNDCDLTTKIETIKSGDEFELVSDSFNSMVERIKSFIAVVQGLSSNTNTTVMAVATNTAQASQNMGQMQNSLQQIASATAQAAKSTQEITVLTQNTSKAVELGNANVIKVMENFQSMQLTTEGTVQSVKKLDQRSQEISEIVGLITKIADQTNLLALNAAIEAARAGEAGRGFAVVADEVRKLAESSSQSAEKISMIIKEIQADTQGVVSASSKAAEETGMMLELMITMQDGYSEMVDAIKGIGKQVEQIAATSEETAAAAEEVTTGAQEQMATMSQIVGTVDSLANGAANLQAEVNKFKLTGAAAPQRQG